MRLNTRMSINQGFRQFGKEFATVLPAPFVKVRFKREIEFLLYVGVFTSGGLLFLPPGVTRLFVRTV